jgi:uncharacterized protein (UPF0261 family)
VRDRLRETAVEVLVVDVGVLGEPPFAPDVAASEVAELGGAELADLRFEREGSDTRAHALEVMGRCFCGASARRAAATARSGWRAVAARR